MNDQSSSASTAKATEKDALFCLPPVGGGGGVVCGDWYRLVSRFSHFTSAAQAVESDSVTSWHFFLFLLVSSFFSLHFQSLHLLIQGSINNHNTYTNRLGRQTQKKEKKKLLQGPGCGVSGP